MTRPTVVIVLLAALTLFVVGDAFAATRVAKVASTAGKVEYRAKSGASWARARLGVQLPPGSQVRTARQSKAEIRFPDGTTFRLGPESVIKIMGVSPARAKLPQGSVFARVVKGSLVRIQGRYGAAAVRGTELLYVAGPGGESLRAWDGPVEYATEIGVVTVTPGTGTAVTAE